MNIYLNNLLCSILNPSRRSKDQWNKLCKYVYICLQIKTILLLLLLYLMINLWRHLFNYFRIEICANCPSQPLRKRLHQDKEKYRQMHTVDFEQKRIREQVRIRQAFFKQKYQAINSISIIFRKLVICYKKKKKK